MTSVLLDFSWINRRSDLLAQYVALEWVLLPLCWPGADGLCACGGNHDWRATGKAPRVQLAPAEAGHLSADYLLSRLQASTSSNVGALLAPSKILVVDADSRPAVAEAKALGLPECPVAARCSDRRHFFFANAEGVQGRTTHRGTSGALDILASGIVVLPPSRHRFGHDYRWLVPPAVPLPAAPPWAYDLLKESKSATNVVRQITYPAELPPCDIYTMPVSPRIRRLVVLGPSAEPGRYKSRSEALFACLLGLIAAGCTDEQIASVVTDPAYAISERANEKGLDWLAGDLARARDQYTELNKQRRGGMGRRTVRITVL